MWRRDERSSKRLGRRGVGLIVKRAAKLAGLQNWQHVTPHCLRKAFESVLRSQTLDGGRMDPSTQQFLFGHVLSGSKDTYYDKTKVEFHRNEYSKLDFSGGSTTSKMVDKLIDISELEIYLVNGWLFVAKVNEDSVVVRSSVGTQ
jgi:hypothetical protein